MRKKNLLVTITALLLLFSTLAFGQKAERKIFAPEYKVGIGTLLNGNPGFAFSNELSMPTIKGFELAASFSFGSTMPDGRVLGWYSEDNLYITTSFTSDRDVEFYNERSMYGINLQGYIRPFDFLKSTALANHHLKVGGGIGYHHQTISGLTYQNGGLIRKIQLDIQSGLEPIVSFQYQYCFRNKWIIGAEYSLVNTDGYDALKLLLGIKL
ncbi:MAG: hypothetical protein ACOYM7_07960 [Paludibacter sp.]